MKNLYYQKLRAVLIFLVIFIHANYESTVFNNYILIFIRTISNVGVAVFFFLSGYFFNKVKYYKNKKEYISQKALRLLIPLLIWNIIYFFVNYDDLSIKTLLTFRTGWQLYFMVVLIQLILLTPLILKNINNKYFKNILLLITPIFLLIHRILNLNFNYTIPLHEFYIFGWIIYYFIGLEYNELKLKNIINKIDLLKLYIPILIIVYLYNILIYKIYGFDLSLSQMNIFNMLFSIITIILIMKYEINDKNETLLSKIGNRAIGIYFIHIFILKVVNKIFEFLVINDVVKILLLTIVTYFISYYVIEIFSKVTNRKFDKILGFV